MNLEALLKNIRIWVLPPILLAAAVLSFWIWAEKELSAPGNLKDILFWEKVSHSAVWAGDLAPLSGYLHHRTAEIIASDSVKPDLAMTFAAMDRIVSDSPAARRIPDLSYSLKIYKKQLLLEMPSILRFYYALTQKLGAGKQKDEFVRFASASAIAKQDLEELSKNETENNPEAAAALYQKLLQKPELDALQGHCLLALAYLSYEGNKAASRKYLNELNKKTHDPDLLQAAGYLKKKLSQKRPTSLLPNAGGWNSTRIPQAMKMGLFNQLKTSLNTNTDGLSNADKLGESKAWLGLAGAEKVESSAPLTRYFKLVSGLQKSPQTVAAGLLDLSALPEMAAQAALLRYQAWQIAYFNAQDFELAFKILSELKAKDPLSSYSQIEQIEGLFRKPSKTLTGDDMKMVWEVEPYRFDLERKDNWQPGQGEKPSEVMVHEGTVYFVKYDAEGKAEKLQVVSGGEKAASSDESAAEEIDLSKMGWVERYFYDLMSRSVPTAVYSFKSDLAERTRDFKEKTFLKDFTEEEFQTYFLSRVQKALGAAAKTTQITLDERGFNFYALFDLKMLKIPVTAVAQVLVDQLDGRLILNIDHATFGPVEAPKWMLQQVEKNFQRTANAEDGLRAGVEILDIQYHQGGIQFKCRKSLLRRS